VTAQRDDERRRREESSAAAGGEWRGQAPRPVGGQRYSGDEPVVRDKRRIDPQTGAVRPDASGAAATPTAPGPRAPEPAAAEPVVTPVEGVETPVPAASGTGLAAQLAERTADLQRLQAEYVNYRRRVDRDREAVRELAVIGVLLELLPVLDDIGRARDHGELEGGFKSVGESLESVVSKLGLERFGAPGQIFDPTVHEALMHTYSAEVVEPTCVEILQPGYRVGTRVIRPARVTVAEPQHASGES
jgi:molecular chaperone GrpE